MRKCMAAALTSIAVLLTFVFATAAEALRSLEIRGESSVTSSGRLTYFEEGLSTEASYSCNVTFTRTLSRVIPKTERTVIGHVTRVALDLGRPGTGEHCSHGSLIRNMLEFIALRNASTETLEPLCRETGSGIFSCDVTGGEAALWQLIYRSFGGTLPAITGVSIDIERAQFKIRYNDILGRDFRCLYRGAIGIRANAEGGSIRSAESLRSRVPLFKDLSRERFCKANIVLGGTFTVSPALTVALL